MPTCVYFAGTGLVVILAFNPCLSDREWQLQPSFDRTDLAYYQRTIFSSYKTCIREKDIRIGETRKTRPNLWSNLLNDFIFFNQKLISQDGHAFLVEAYRSDPGYQTAYFGLLIFILLVLAFGFLAILIVCVIGIIMFRTFFKLYNFVTKSGIRKYLRIAVIKYELGRRKRQDYLIGASSVQKKPPKRRFRLVNFLRDYSDEEVPEELREPDEAKYKIAKDSSSSSEFEDESFYIAQDLEEAEMLLEKAKQAEEDAQSSYLAKKRRDEIQLKEIQRRSVAKKKK